MKIITVLMEGTCFSSKFSKVYEKTIAIREKDSKPTVPRNPLSLKTIALIKETKNLLI